MTEAISIERISEQLATQGCKVEPCGSRVTCSPAPTDTDRDYLVEIVSNASENVGSIVNHLSGYGFEWEGGEHYQDAASTFMSWRRGDTNLIVTADPTFADRHRAATAVCKRLNLLNKQDRIALFQAVLYGNQWDGEATVPTKPPFVLDTNEVPW